MSCESEAVVNGAALFRQYMNVKMRSSVHGCVDRGSLDKELWHGYEMHNLEKQSRNQDTARV